MVNSNTDCTPYMARVICVCIQGLSMLPLSLLQNEASEPICSIKSQGPVDGTITMLKDFYAMLHPRNIEESSPSSTGF